MTHTERVIWLVLATIAAVPVFAVSIRYVNTGEWSATGASATFALWVLIGCGAGIRAMGML